MVVFCQYAKYLRGLFMPILSNRYAAILFIVRALSLTSLKGMRLFARIPLTKLCKLLMNFSPTYFLSTFWVSFFSTAIKGLMTVFFHIRVTDSILLLAASKIFWTACFLFLSWCSYFSLIFWLFLNHIIKLLIVLLLPALSICYVKRYSLLFPFVFSNKISNAPFFERSKYSLVNI